MNSIMWEEISQDKPRQAEIEQAEQPQSVAMTPIARPVGRSASTTLYSLLGCYRLAYLKNTV